MTSSSSSSWPSPSAVELTALPPLKPDLFERAWCSVPHPTLPLLATAHARSVTIFSLSTLSSHSNLAGGHSRSVRSVSWKPNLPPRHLCLVTGSFDSTAGLWRWDDENHDADADVSRETEVTAITTTNPRTIAGDDSDSDADPKDWEFTLVLEGHDSEIKWAAFSPSGAHLATCSRDQTVWVWEDVGPSERDDEWETVAVLNEHDGDMKSLAWCPDVPGRNNPKGTARAVYGADVLATASYDNTVRVWREDADAEWVCVAVLEGHEATIWDVQWEARPRPNGRFPRLLTASADRSIRVWTLRQEEEAEENGGGEGGDTVSAEQGDGEGSGGGSGGGFAPGLIPNTMRQSLREDWYCSHVLPAAHTRDIYAIAWSAKTGLVASTGSDGIIAVYGEVDGGKGEGEPLATSGESSAPLPPETTAQVGGGEGGEKGTNVSGNGQTNGASHNVDTSSSSKWRVLTTVNNAHGPYEVNHVTWCPRYDPGARSKGEEEMLVSTGDEGLVKPWQVTISP